VSDEQSTTTPVEVAAPVEAPEAKSGFLSTATGRIVAIVVGLGVLGVLAGVVVAIVLFVFASDVVDDIEVRVPEGTEVASEGEEGESEGVAATAAARPVANSEIFTFRDIFDPLLRPLSEPSAPSTTTPDDVTPTTDGTLYLNDIITEDGVLKAVLLLNDTTYTLAVGESIPGTPWQVLRLTSTQATMLYGDVPVTLSIGQGILK